MSLFLSDKLFPVPLAAFEYLSQQDFSTMGDLDTWQVYLDVLSRFCGIHSPTEVDVEYLLSRITEVSSAEGKDDDKPVSKGKSFGTSYLEALKGLTTDKLLLLACNMDYSLAMDLYCKQDKEVAMATVDMWIAMKMQEHTIMFEAVMYGFGGSYKDEGQPKEPQSAQELFGSLAAAGINL